MSFKESLKESFKYACSQPTTPKKDVAPPTKKEPSNQEVVIRTYAGSQNSAASKFQLDSSQMAARGYYPSSQSWAAGSYGCGFFILALLLVPLYGLGVLVLIYMLLVKPDKGTLTVTYEFREAVSPSSNEVKSCPQCAEHIKTAAKVCRFCGYTQEAEIS